MTTPIRAVAFDLDGTLVDSVPDLAASANAMRTELGLPALPQNEIQDFVGDGIPVLVHRALTGSRHAQADMAVFQQGLSVFARHYAANLANATRPYPEAEAALGLLKSLGLPLAVITNKNETLAVKLLRDLGLDAYFSMVVGGDTLPERKPSPEPLRHVAEILGVEPEHMLMVGDSANDILAAKAAHCPNVLVTFGYGDVAELSRHQDTRPDHSISHLPELYDWVRQRNAAAAKDSA
ncbi:phosphoglycolate phosphatase [Conchiformibius steedae]|uniref:phosphoglycolate phosphatase n=1 Tax=Conchiformibius steedae TaxID=153493 RepID=UPI0026EC632E|nr:phosphoglycolate phosphatase [Conchiformibius steedae]